MPFERVGVLLRDFHTHRFKIGGLYNLDCWAGVEMLLPGNFLFSAGIHPWSLPTIISKEEQERTLRSLEDLITTGQIVALGECGWDPKSKASYADQDTLFRAQWLLAERYRLPMVLHVVRSWSYLDQFIKQEHPSVPLIVHGFRSNSTLAESLLRKGVWLSFGRYYQPESLQKAWQAGRLLVETDDAPIEIEAVYRQVVTDLAIAETELQRHLAEASQLLFPSKSLDSREESHSRS